MKSIFPLTLIAATISACSNNKYVVIGETDAADSTMVIMIESLTGQPKDTAIVKDGTFTFTGSQAEPAMRHIVVNRTILTAIVLENNNIKITKNDNGYTVSGTPLNDTLQTVNSKLTSIYKQLELLEKQYAPTLPLEERNAIETKYNELNNKMKQVAKNATINNIDNAFGIYMLFSTYNDFEPEELQNIINQIPNNVITENPNLQKIKATNDASMKNAKGKVYTDLELSTPDGKIMKLSTLIQGNKYTLIDFWASWCGPCRAEMPNVIEAYNLFKDKGFGIVGISLDNNAESWKRAIAELGIAWPQLSDLKGWKSIAADTYGVTGIPFTLLIDNSTGIIIERNLRGNDINKKLSELLK